MAIAAPLALSISLALGAALQGSEVAYQVPESYDDEVALDDSTDAQPVDHVLKEPAPTAPAPDPSKAAKKKAADKQKALAKQQAGAYKPVYYNNDFSYLNDPAYCGWALGEYFKQNQVCCDTTVDVGGEYRLRFHGEHNMRTRPLSGFNDDFLLQRTRLYLNLKHNEWLRFYAEGIDAASEGNRHPSRAIEVNRFDALNLFADARLTENIWFRGGRQELIYGNQRLVSPLDWSNTRRTFDGLKAFYKSDAWDFDAFWTRPVPLAQHLPDDTNFDSNDSSQEFLGCYATYKAVENHTYDFYFLRLAEYDIVNIGGQAVDGYDNNTFGARWQGKSGSWLMELEGGYQFGEYNQLDKDAGFYTVGVGHEWANAKYKPVVWVYYDWASGDSDPNDGHFGTFNQLFPLGHKYLGFMDFFARQNIETANVQTTLQLNEKMSLLFWYYVFWLDSKTDFVSDAGGTRSFVDPTGSSSPYLGQELDILLQWTLTPRSDIWFGYSHFWTGDYFKSPTVNTVAPPPGVVLDPDDADFFYCQWALRF